MLNLFENAKEFRVLFQLMPNDIQQASPSGGWCDNAVPTLLGGLVLRAGGAGWEGGYVGGGVIGWWRI